MSILPITIKYIIISTSLNPKSRTRVLAKTFFESISSTQKNVELIDLVNYNLPICDGDSAYSNENVGNLMAKIKEANSIILCSPIYNYDMNSSAKNLLELTGQAWRNKIVGFACTAGGKGSYMAPMGFANSLMVDFRCIILPRFVYATEPEITKQSINSQELLIRIEELSKTLIHFTTALAPHLSILSLGQGN